MRSEPKFKKKNALLEVFHTPHCSTERENHICFKRSITYNEAGMLLRCTESLLYTLSIRQTAAPLPTAARAPRLALSVEQPNAEAVNAKGNKKIEVHTGVFSRRSYTELARHAVVNVCGLI